MRTQEQVTAEQATGCAENPHGLGAMYAGAINRKGMVSEGGYVVNREEAQDYIMEGGDIAVPNAGAGSYRAVLVDMLGYKDCKVIEWSSSAGDWSFGVWDGYTWFAAYQSNRYPRCGMAYGVDHEYNADTFEQLCSFMEG